jgi:3D (Asp-Asp-Asp) domain-containing protein
MKKIVVMFLYLFSGCAYAQVEVGQAQWLVMGLGSKSCGSYVLALSQNQTNMALISDGQRYPTMAFAYGQWVDGFVSGTNLSRHAGAEQINVDPSGIDLWVDNYCKKHPAQTIVDAAGAFIRTHPK